MRKNGISLIVLSMSIIVMAILAATAIISLENSGIIGRAKNTATSQSNIEEYTKLQVIKNGILTDNLGEITVDQYIAELKRQGVIEDTITTDSFGNKVAKTKSGQDLYLKQDGESNVIATFEEICPEFGDLITAANYGDTVDYEVTVNGTKYTDWLIYYHNDEYIYLISKEGISGVPLNKGIRVDSLTAEELALYEKFRVGNAPKFTLADTVNGYTAYNCQAVAQLIKEYGNFANKSRYGSYVVGAIGSPTLELMTAGWNAKGYTPQFTLSLDTYGYRINNAQYVGSLVADGMYVTVGYVYWLASPACGNASGYGTMLVGNDGIRDSSPGANLRVRPVVCLRSDIPAKVGTTTDFSLAK